ncbi:MAG: ATPase [Pyrinomonadaceae bacterium]|nr:ATPase [Pyrinomonadaceae bacterium]
MKKKSSRLSSEKTKRFGINASHNSKKRISEPAICKKCEAFYQKGRWTLDKNEIPNDPFERVEPTAVICPACRQIESGNPSGFVYLKGSFLDQHLEEIKNLLKNEEQKTARTNPLARIMSIKSAKGDMIVTTTTEHLAQHLGRTLNRAYGGTVRYDFSNGNKLVRVYWQRDD